MAKRGVARDIETTLGLFVCRYVLQHLLRDKMLFATQKIKFVLAYMRGAAAIYVAAVQENDGLGEIDAAAVGLIRVEHVRVIDVRAERGGEQTPVNADADHDIGTITFLLDLRMLRVFFIKRIRKKDEIQKKMPPSEW